MLVGVLKQVRVCHDPQYIICWEQSLIHGLNQTLSVNPYIEQDLERARLNANQGLAAWLSCLNVESSLVNLNLVPWRGHTRSCKT